MKKIILILAVAVLTMSFNSVMFAQGGKGNPKAPKTNWIDANNDGVCDNYTGTPKMNKGTTKPNFVDADGDGVCDNGGGTCTGTGQGRKVNFVDADGDGVCDNVGNPVKQRLQDGSGSGNGSKGGAKQRGKK